MKRKPQLLQKRYFFSETIVKILDAGESEAIAMSLEWPADLLIMEESSGRAGHCEI